MAKHQITKDWFRLDNAAKIFPAVSTKKETNTFRVQIVMTEVIDPDLLQLATDAILERFPMFKVRLKSGLFWFYFDYNEQPFIVKPLPHQICGPLSPKENNGYMFQIYYRAKMITLEMFHSLADATGALTLLKSLIYEYLLLAGKQVTPDNMILTKDSRPSVEEYEDANLAFYNPDNHKHVPEKKAFYVQGTPINDDYVGLISGTVSTMAMIDLARRHQATVTEFMVAHLMHIIYITQIKYREHLPNNKKPVKIFVPVNLRKHFPSQTLRNFANFTKTEMYMNKADIRFEDILTLVKEQFKFGLDVKELQRKMSENVAFEKNIFLRLTPLFLKKFVMKIGYQIMGLSLNTLSFSNIGRVDFPKSMEPYIEKMSAAVYSGKFNTLNCAIVSFGDQFSITFSRSIVETTIEREFFRFFTSIGIPVEIESNYVEEY